MQIQHNQVASITTTTTISQALSPAIAYNRACLMHKQSRKISGRINVPYSNS